MKILLTLNHWLFQMIALQLLVWILLLKSWLLHQVEEDHHPRGIFFSYNRDIISVKIIKACKLTSVFISVTIIFVWILKLMKCLCLHLPYHLY